MDVWMYGYVRMYLCVCPCVSVYVCKAMCVYAYV